MKSKIAIIIIICSLFIATALPLVTAHDFDEKELSSSGLAPASNNMATVQISNDIEGLNERRSEESIEHLKQR